MAIRVFKRTYSAAIPDDAERCQTTVTRRGKKLTVDAVRFRDPSTNKRITCPLTDDGQFMLRESEYFYGTVGGNRVCLEVSRKDVAEAKLADLIAKHQRGEAGLISPFAKFEAMPIAQHVEDWREAMKAKGNSAQHVSASVNRVTAILEGCGVTSTKNADSSQWADRVTRWLAEQRVSKPAELPEGDTFDSRQLAALLKVSRSAIVKALERASLPVASKGKKTLIPREHALEVVRRSTKSMSPATSNHYLTAFKMFTHWLQSANRIGVDPMDEAKKIRESRDVRRARRKLTQEEFTKLVQTARASEKTVQGLKGTERAMLYLLLVSTGLRLRAARLLTPSNFDLDSNPATLACPAELAKNGKAAIKFLPSVLVGQLRASLAGRQIAGLGDEPIFARNGENLSKAVMMIRHDLRSAGVPYAVTGQDGVTRYADFHAMKHKFISDLLEAGVSLATVREMADHSDIRTTQRYCHSDQSQKVNAVESLNLPGLNG